MRLAFVFLLLLGSLQAINAAKPDRIIFHGNREFSSSELARFLDVAKEMDWSHDNLAKHLSSLQDSMIARDFVFASVDSAAVRQRGKKTDLHIYIREERIPRVREVRWLGDSSRVPGSVASRILTISGTVFHWSNLDYDAKTLLDYFENSGYPFAQVDIERVESDPVTETVDVWLKVYSGPFTVLEFIAFEGNRQTGEALLRRESRLRISERYSQKRMESARRRLSRLDYLKHVDKAEITINEYGKTGVRFPLEEGRVTRIDAVAGFQPSSQSRSGTLSGLVNLEFLNLFGTGRRARVHWERPNRRIQAIELSYKEPWVFRQPVSLRVDFGQRIEDTLYVTRKVGLRSDVDAGGGLLLWGAMQQEEVLVDSASSANLNLPDCRTFYLESGFSYDTRDHPSNPRTGFCFSTFAGTGWRQRHETDSLSSSRSFRHHRGGIDSEVAQEFFPYWIVDASLHARVLQSTEPEILPPDLYYLGGARTLRGYREEQFRGSRIGWASAELRYWLGPASRFFFFCDAGSFYRAYHEGEVFHRDSRLKMGAGIGLRLETSLGVWGFDYGVGENDHLLNGKLHVSLLSTF